MTRLCLVVAIAGVLAGPAPIRVDVWPRRAIGHADVRVLTTVERNPDNRELVIVVDGPEYRAQHVQLNTHPELEDPRLQERWFKYVTPGAYLVHATLTRRGGRQFVASSSFCLVGIDVSCEEGQ